MEEFKCLRLDLQEAVESDNVQYRSEQERETQRRRHQVSGHTQFSRDPDHDDTPPPGGCGAGPGGGSFNTASRVVFWGNTSGVNMEWVTIKSTARLQRSGFTYFMLSEFSVGT